MNLLGGGEDNHCIIQLDEKEYAAPEIFFSYDASMRHILVVNDWLDDSGQRTGEDITAAESMRIVFSEDERGTEQADRFHGMIVCGIRPSP